MVNLRDAENIARIMLRNDIGDRIPSEDDIKAAIEKASSLIALDSNEKEYLEKILQSSFKVQMDLGEDVHDESTYSPWLAHRKAKIDDYYWKRYARYLEIDLGWMPTIIESLDDVSDRILDLCGNPEDPNPWKRKGLILGDIQSGKTSNYLALCNKAADAGYKVIILLTGTVEPLRKQTQERVDAGFVGLNSRNVLKKNPEKKYLGVGNIDCTRTAYQFTDVLTDFNMNKLQSLNFTIKGLSEPVILVLKKNKKVLENLTTWLKSRNTDRQGEKIDLPLLLIDDEADNASVNTNKPDQDPTAINKAIVEVLKMFNRFSYVAVTATPFANIFIDPDLDMNDGFNLFPSDFIYALSPPTNYIGARNIFTGDAEYTNSLETIEDVAIDIENNRYVFRSRDRSAHIVPFLPSSLKKAIRYFLLVNTIRDLDGANKTHRSMLINVSQYVNVQSQVYELVSTYLKELKSKIQSYSKLGIDRASQHTEIKDILNTWDEYSLTEVTGYSKEEMLDALYEGVSPIQVSIVNGRSKEFGIEKLDYEPYKEFGLRVIAVGGNSLSRGLTLEGLCVSYFDRNSQMYDTLMQMGRWFGYRSGYENLFKIWMEPNAINWYQYITNAITELRNDISEMRRTGLTPKEFGLQVQENMTALFVTARSKMRATEIFEKWVSLAAELVETPRLVANIETCLKPNLNNTCSFLEEIINGAGKYSAEYNYEKNRVVYTDIDKNKIADFISTFIAHPRHIPFSAKDLSEHIRDPKSFDKWTVSIVGGSGDKYSNEYFPQEIINLGLKYSKRVMIRDENCLLISGERARVGAPGATKCGLTKKQVDAIDEQYRSDPRNEGKTIPDKVYLRIPRDPVLLIYFIEVDQEDKTTRKFNSDKKSKELVRDLPVVGLGIGFPGEYDGSNRDSTRVKYVLNRVKVQEVFNFEDGDDEDEY
ncbi:MAG: Z1 domain-containing protein [Eubacterium sp.]|nr:Z1 domain-containing protein [Eubacterium sp.]